MLSLEDQIHRYGDYLEGEALRDVEVEVALVESSPGRSRLAIAALVVLVTGLAVLVAFANLRGDPRGDPAVPADPAVTLSGGISTIDQMRAFDHSDGIALEVVGDELWILGNGFGNPVVNEPFRIYVTGADGQLLRTIDLGRHFNEMGQSDSYVWLLADGFKSEAAPRDPEIVRINKLTGEMERIDWFYPYEPLVLAVFSDDVFWFTEEDGTLLRKWTYSTRLTTANLGNDDGILAVEVFQEMLMVAMGDGQMRLATLDGQGGYSGLSGDESPVIALESDGEVVWALHVDGHVLSYDDNFEQGPIFQCRGATHLAAISGGGVVASNGFDFCEIR
ncbi:MAG: hypothetical protein ACC652_13715, partial [Acidimicrobiales bacterium]